MSLARLTRKMLLWFDTNTPERRVRLPRRTLWGFGRGNKVVAGVVAQYVDAHIKSGHRHHADKLRDAYTLFVSKGLRWCGDYRIYRDCAYTIVLCAPDPVDGPSPIACIGFDIPRWKNHIVVGQIQGVSKNSQSGQEHLVRHFLLPLQWEQMLLAIVRDYAREECFDEVRVIPAHAQAYYTPTRHDAFTRRYEGTPSAMGFTKIHSGHHVLHLSS